MNRRDTLKTTIAATAVGASSLAQITSHQQEDAGELTRDEKFVMEAGMTRKEAECWRLTAEAAGSFFKLPKLHPTDAAEVAQAIHVIQNKLLGRPTYRKYIELAKAAAESK